MKNYLIDAFRYNSMANCRLAEAIVELPQPEEAIALFSHIINAQNKWFNRLTREHDDQLLQWNAPLYRAEELVPAWTKSVNSWISRMESCGEEDLGQDITFRRMTDGKEMAVKISDVALQLNYHAIHHRAQINTLISKQGHPVPATDYIFTVLRETEQ